MPPVNSATARAQRRGGFGDALLALAFSFVGLGNLILPPVAQDVLGVDYLIIAFGVLGLLIFFRIRRVVTSPQVWLWSALIPLGALPGFLVAGMNSYGSLKLFSFVTVFLLALAASAFVDIERGVAYTTRITLSVAVGVSLLSLLLQETTVGGRATLFDLNPLGVSRVTGLAIVIGAIFALQGKRNRPWYVLFAALGLISTSFTLSRGPLVSAFVALAVVLGLMLFVRQVRSSWIVLLVIGSAIVTWLAVWSGWFQFAEAFFRGDSGRGHLFPFALQQFLLNPLGIGWGSFFYAGDIAFESDDARYPHNLFLEFAVEGGVVALVALVAALLFIARAASTAFVATKDPLVLAVIGIFIYALVNAQFSSDVTGNRMLWVSMALAAALASYHRQRARMAPTLASDSDKPPRSDGRQASDRSRRGRG